MGSRLPLDCPWPRRWCMGNQRLISTTAHSPDLHWTYKAEGKTKDGSQCFELNLCLPGCPKLSIRTPTPHHEGLEVPQSTHVLLPGSRVSAVSICRCLVCSSALTFFLLFKNDIIVHECDWA